MMGFLYNKSVSALLKSHSAASERLTLQQQNNHLKNSFISKLSPNTLIAAAEFVSVITFPICWLIFPTKLSGRPTKALER